MYMYVSALLMMVGVFIFESKLPARITHYISINMLSENPEIWNENAPHEPTNLVVQSAGSPKIMR